MTGAACADSSGAVRLLGGGDRGQHRDCQLEDLGIEAIPPHRLPEARAGRMDRRRVHGGA